MTCGQFNDRDRTKPVFFTEVLSGGFAVAGDEEIRKKEEQARVRRGEQIFAGSGIAKKWRNVDFCDLKKAKMPEVKTKNGTLCDFSVFEDIAAAIAGGGQRTLWFCGPPGTAKTTVAVALMHELCRAGVDCAYFKMHKIMQRFDDAKHFSSKESAAGITAEICAPRFRIIDEIGRWPVAEAEGFRLFDITNECYESGRSSVYISNAGKNGLGALVGEAATDRCRATGMTFEFAGKSLRGLPDELYV